jgi:hypothetical protein
MYGFGIPEQYIALLQEGGPKLELIFKNYLFYEFNIFLVIKSNVKLFAVSNHVDPVAARHYEKAARAGVDIL